jgi:hypothetical protein
LLLHALIPVDCAEDGELSWDCCRYKLNWLGAGIQVDEKSGYENFSESSAAMGARRRLGQSGGINTMRGRRMTEEKNSGSIKMGAALRINVVVPESKSNRKIVFPVGVAKL